jgi:hypothetical protein
MNGRDFAGRVHSAPAMGNLHGNAQHGNSKRFGKPRLGLHLTRKANFGEKSGLTDHSFYGLAKQSCGRMRFACERAPSAPL